MNETNRIFPDLTAGRQTASPALAPERAAVTVEPSAAQANGAKASRACLPSNHTDSDYQEAEERAAICRKFIQLTTEGGMSVRMAATTLGKSVSFFAGKESMLARFQRDGLAGLLPTSRGGTNAGDLTTQLEMLGWFIPAAKFFYLQTNRDRSSGSIPEAIRCAISLPHLPTGWTNAVRNRFLQAISLDAAPTCPPEIRETILARQNAGQELVPERVAKQITVNRSVIEYHRNPRNWELNNLSAPGSARRHHNEDGQWARMQAGDWFGGDDATPGIAVCVPCNEVMTPCSQKFQVLIGRFQWLAFVDCAYDYALGFDYVVRPRGSYRAEDILHGMRTVTMSHGIPHVGWQFEGGTFNSHLVRNTIKAMGCQHWRTYSPHQKVVEILFNKAWTRLASRFPQADLGRYRGENQENCQIYEACKRGERDPRRYFPTLSIVIQVFREVLAEHNRTLIKSANYGQWIPEVIFQEQTKARELRKLSAESHWMFSPFAFERTVRGMIVGGRVPMFEDFSVPFEFTAHWLPEYSGARVRCHFDPRDPHCNATLVLCQSWGTHKAGEVIGSAQLINSTAGYIRMAMGWAEDNTQAGRVARQKTAGWMRRESRAIGAGGKLLHASSEQRDGIASETRVERTTDLSGPEAQTNSGPITEPGSAAAGQRPATAAPFTSDRTTRLAALRAETERIERENQDIFL